MSTDTTPTVMPLSRLAGIARELTVTQRLQPVDRPRLALDILWYRAMRFTSLPREDTARTIGLRDGSRLTYRLNRGDLQAIREIWIEGAYIPPPEASDVRYIVDLGANIGLTSVYLHRQLKPDYVIAVEPDPANAAILRRNLAQNGVPALVLEAAAGPVDGRAGFRRERDSNVGKLDAAGGLEVDVLSIASILDMLPDHPGQVLLKMDIEGGEDAVFRGDLSWLNRIHCFQGELHLGHADTDGISALLDRSGLPFRPGAIPGRGPAACWVRT
jgi:FkbM family methyltransferase